MTLKKTKKLMHEWRAENCIQGFSFYLNWINLTAKFNCKYYNFISENDFWKINPVLNLPTDEEGERCENKKGGWKLHCTCKQCMIVLFQQTAYLDRRCVESWGSIPPDSDTGILPSNSHRRHYCTDCSCPHTHQYLQHRKTKYKLQLGVDFYIRITW